MYQLISVLKRKRIRPSIGSKASLCLTEKGAGRIKIPYFDLGEILSTLHTYPATTAGTRHIFKLNNFFKVFHKACVTIVGIFDPFVLYF